MFLVLFRAFSFAFIIVIGIVMRSGLLPDNAEGDHEEVLIYITLPAAIIINFSAITTWELT